MYSIQNTPQKTKNLEQHEPHNNNKGRGGRWSGKPANYPS